MQLNIIWRQAHSYLFTNLPWFSNSGINPWRNPWQTVFATDLSRFIRPNAHRGNKEWESAMPVVTDCCLRHLLWLIVVFVSKRGIIGTIRHLQYKRGILIPIGQSRPEKGMLGLKGNSSHVRASWTKMTYSSQKNNFVLKWLSWPERVFVVRKGIHGLKGHSIPKGQSRPKRVCPERVFYPKVI